MKRSLILTVFSFLVLGQLSLAHVVDNQNNTYMVLAAWTVSTTMQSIMLLNARITYTVDQPLP